MITAVTESLHRQPMIDSSDYGYPPNTRRQDYALVVLQLLWRMRFDLLLLLLITVLVHNDWIPRSWSANESVVRIMGIAASIFLGFRNTQAIARWWEARKLWGTVVNVSRNWADSLRAHLDTSRPPELQERKLLRLQVAIVWQLNFQLRNFWQRDLRDLQDQLLEDLRLPRSTTSSAGTTARRLDRRSPPGGTQRWLRTTAADGSGQRLHRRDRRIETDTQDTPSGVLRGVRETAQIVVRSFAVVVFP